MACTRPDAGSCYQRRNGNLFPTCVFWRCQLSELAAGGLVVNATVCIYVYLCTHMPCMTHVAGARPHSLQPWRGPEPALTSSRVGEHPPASPQRHCRGCGNRQGFILELLRCVVTCAFPDVPFPFFVMSEKADLAEQRLDAHASTPQL